MSESSIKSWGLWKRALCFPFLSWLLTEGEINVSNLSPLAWSATSTKPEVALWRWPLTPDALSGLLYQLTWFLGQFLQRLEIEVLKDYGTGKKDETLWVSGKTKQKENRTLLRSCRVRLVLFFGLLKEMLNKMLNKTFNTRKALWWYRTQKVQN